MTEIPVGEGIGGSLEPDNDSVHLGKRPDERVVDVEVNGNGGNGQSQRNIDSVCPGNEDPGGVEFPPIFLRRT